MNLNNKIFTINDNNKALSVFHKNKPYIIGFESCTTARYIQYNISENDPILYIQRKKETSVNIPFKNYNIPYHLSVNLLLQKKARTEDITKNKYKLEIIERDEFLCFPIDKVLGIILSSKIVDENMNEITINSKMIEACFIPEYYRNVLMRNNK